MNDETGDKDVRAERLADALKANLRRRKQQARGRRGKPEADAPPPPAKGPVPAKD